MRNISISTCFDYSLPLDSQLPLIQEAGFSHVSIGSRYEHSGILNEKNTKKLALALNALSLSVDTIHGEVLDRPDVIETTKRIAHAANELSAGVIVVHCSTFTFKPEQYDERYADVMKKMVSIERIAAEHRVKFAVENVLPGIATDLAKRVILESNPDLIGFCYDSSHDQVDGPRPFTLLDELKHRLIAVHLSDRIKEFVDHVIPGEGFIDFNGITKLIRDSSYKEPLIFEVMTTNSSYKEPSIFLKSVYDKACAIYDRIYNPAL